MSKRVQQLLRKLPHDINPKGLEELRKVKTALVEVEDRTDTLRYAHAHHLGRVAKGTVDLVTRAQAHIMDRTGSSNVSEIQACRPELVHDFPSD